MGKNVGNADRLVRIALGIAAIGAGIAFNSWWGAVGIIPLGTALVGWCPLYRILGLSTCPVRTRA